VHGDRVAKKPKNPKKPIHIGDAALSLRWSLAFGPPGPNIGGATDQSVAELGELVKMLLLGWVDAKTGKHEYFERGSRKERAALRAAAYLLQNMAKPLSIEIRNLLGNLFDPGSINARSLTLGFRRKPDARLKHRRIAAEMRRMVRAGEMVEAAVDMACSTYGISERTARSIWSRFGLPMMQ
jgi:hypothetical protein